MEPLANIPTDETVFIDANIFVYHCISCLETKLIVNHKKERGYIL